MRRWLLPESPDTLGQLRAQAQATVAGMDAFCAWAEGDADAADRVRTAEHLADDRKRELRRALTQAFTTPLEPEDLFELSRSLDQVINACKDTVGEAEVMGVGPDAAIVAIAGQLADGTRHLADAFAAIDQPDAVTTAPEAADRAVKCQRNIEHVYRGAMSELLDVEDLREVTARRELYRRLVRASEHLADVAERVWYSVLKGS